MLTSFRPQNAVNARQARATFAALIHSAEPTVITSHGHTAAVLLPLTLTRWAGTAEIEAELVRQTTKLLSPETRAAARTPETRLSTHEADPDAPRTQKRPRPRTQPRSRRQRAKTVHKHQLSKRGRP